MISSCTGMLNVSHAYIWSIPVVATVTAKIYDVTGKQIRMIELGHVTAGNYVESSSAIYWDGRTEDGEQVSSGTYFYQIEAGEYTETRKMVILK